MGDTVEQLKSDAAATLAAGQTCDRLVLRAIGLGFNTRSMLKGALAVFDYAAIEKALERESGSLRSRQDGPFERFSLASGNGHESKATPFNSFIPAKDEHIMKSESKDAPVSKEKCGCGRDRWHKGRCSARRVAASAASVPELTCESCGKPRAPGSGRKCRPCYEGKTPESTPRRAPVVPDAPQKKGRKRVIIDVAKARELKEQGMTRREIADALNVNYWTFRNEIERNPEMAEAVGGPTRKKNVSPLDHIEEKPSPVAPTSVKISAINSKTGAIVSEPKAVLAIEPSTLDDLKRRIAKILYIEDPNSPVLADALTEADRYFAAKVLSVPGHALESPAELLARFNNLPSAVLKEIREDDAYFSNAYDTLIGILDDRMNSEEKGAIWTLILYLKSLEKERYGQENQ